MDTCLLDRHMVDISIAGDVVVLRTAAPTQRVDMRPAQARSLAKLLRRAAIRIERESRPPWYDIYFAIVGALVAGVIPLAVGNLLGAISDTALLAYATPVLALCAVGLGMSIGRIISIREADRE